MPATVPEEGFRCDVQPARERVIVRPVGELDLATVPVLQRELAALRETGFGVVVLDLRRVTFLDSTGLRLLISEAAGADAVGIRLGIVADSAPVLRLLDLTGARERLPIVPAREADDV